MVDGYGAFSGLRIGRRNLPHCHFVHHKSHDTCPGMESRPLLIYGLQRSIPKHYFIGASIIFLFFRYVSIEFYLSIPRTVMNQYRFMISLLSSRGDENKGSREGRSTGSPLTPDPPHNKNAPSNTISLYCPPLVRMRTVVPSVSLVGHRPPESHQVLPTDHSLLRQADRQTAVSSERSLNNCRAGSRRTKTT
jgi:hypothetical protein